MSSSQLPEVGGHRQGSHCGKRRRSINWERADRVDSGTVKAISRNKEVRDTVKLRQTRVR